MAAIYVLAVPLGIVIGIAAGLLIPNRAKRPQRH
jgi:uncharacterized protein YneF (UPF0154 family)